MKKTIYISTIFLMLFSCKKESNIVNGNTPLKNIPQQVFIKNGNTKIQLKDSIINYVNHFKRLPNTEFSKFYLKNHPDLYMPYFNITLNLSMDKKITFDGAELLKNEVIKDLIDYIDFAAEGKQALIHLNFDENLSFKDFYQFYQFIKPLENKNIKFNERIFIYNKKLLPDCDCSL